MEAARGDENKEEARGVAHLGVDHESGSFHRHHRTGVQIAMQQRLRAGQEQVLVVGGSELEVRVPLDRHRVLIE
jgi:hypothetical protein